MKHLNTLVWLGASSLLLYAGSSMNVAAGETLVDGSNRATIAPSQNGELRDYTLSTTAELRGDSTKRSTTFGEYPDRARIRTGDVMFDGLYAMAVHEAVLNSVSQIKDGAYDRGKPIKLDAFQTGEFWTYVWTRDLSYSVYLALAQFDPRRAVNSLLFKTSVLKPSIVGSYRNQIIQDTGSGGSYPVSSDRIVWAMGADETLKFLPEAEQKEFLHQVYPILHDTIEQDRRLIFDQKDGLYRGEQSFLDWREQTYPGWTKDNVLPIAMSKALSVNAANYFLLKTTSAYAGRLGIQDDKIRYAQWATALKDSINRQFWDANAGLYSTYLLSDGLNEVRVERYDLLGESLAILFDVADQTKARLILKNYPAGPHGPSVVWPQEQTVPIYHNQAIWPFVTAYWIKAARKANDSDAVNAGIRSLEYLAALNLSNMENYDFVTGKAEVKAQQLNGPVINSRRQLWSVAGYLSMVQDVVFGLESSWEGIRFRSFITAQLRNETFANSDRIELMNFDYQGSRNQVCIHLPSKDSGEEGACTVTRVQLNGKDIGNAFVSRAELHNSNQWDVYLAAPNLSQDRDPLRLVDVRNQQALFGPVQPAWDESQGGGITVEGGKLVLHYQQSDVANVVFNIYRDGKLCANSIHGTNWTDNASGDYLRHVHYYTVAAVDPMSGNASHLTPPRCHLSESQQLIIPASDMKNQGGQFVADNHFENWGKPGDTLLTKPFKVEHGGSYVIRAKFSNGSGAVNTGITCAVKLLELCEVGTGKVIASGHLVMPQSGDWKRLDLSSPMTAELAAGRDYFIKISEDVVSRNMSYLMKNERYTAWSGGGPTCYNFVNIPSLHLIWLYGDKDSGETNLSFRHL